MDILSGLGSLSDAYKKFLQVNQEEMEWDEIDFKVIDIVLLIHYTE